MGGQPSQELPPENPHSEIESKAIDAYAASGCCLRVSKCKTTHNPKGCKNTRIYSYIRIYVIELWYLYIYTYLLLLYYIIYNLYIYIIYISYIYMCVCMCIYICVYIVYVYIYIYVYTYIYIHIHTVCCVCRHVRHTYCSCVFCNVRYHTEWRCLRLWLGSKNIPSLRPRYLRRRSVFILKVWLSGNRIQSNLTLYITCIDFYIL